MSCVTSCSTFNAEMGQDDRAWNQQISDVIRQSRAADVGEYVVAIDWNELPMLRKLSRHLRMVPQRFAFSRSADRGSGYRGRFCRSAKPLLMSFRGRR